MRVIAVPVEPASQSGISLEEDRNLSAKLAALQAGTGAVRRKLDPEELERRREAAFEAMRDLRILNPFGEIADPAEWQREVRGEMSDLLPG